MICTDQHAAHERILFDKLSSYAGNIPAQQLLIHRILHFDSRESLVVEKYLELFAELGFGMELAGQNEFRLMEIPADASDADAEEMMREIISSLPEDSNFACGRGKTRGHFKKYSAVGFSYYCLSRGD